MGCVHGPSIGARTNTLATVNVRSQLFVIKQARTRNEVFAAGVGMPASLCAELLHVQLVDAGLGEVAVSLTFVQRLLKQLGHRYRTATAALDKKRAVTEIVDEQLRLKLQLCYIQRENDVGPDYTWNLDETALKMIIGFRKRSFGVCIEGSVRSQYGA